MFTDGRTDGRTDGQTTDGLQAHRYIARTFRSGKKLRVTCPTGMGSLFDSEQLV